MAMTKKDYEAIAQSIRYNVDEWTKLSVDESSTDTFQQTCRTRLAALRMQCLDLCSVFSRSNPAFDQQRFMKACGF